MNSMQYVSYSTALNRVRVLFLLLLAGFAWMIIRAESVSAATCTFGSNGGATLYDFNTAANWSCGVVPGAGDSVIIPANTSTNATGLNIFVSSVSSSGSFRLNDSNLNATTTLTINAGYVSSTSGGIYVSSTVTIWGGTVSSTSGLFNFAGSTTNAGTLSSVSGNMLFGANFSNSGRFLMGSGSATTTGHSTTTVDGVFNLGTGVYSVQGSFWMNGTFQKMTGKIRVSGSSDQFLPGLIYHDFDSTKTGGTATFTGTSTIAGTFATLDAGTIRATSTAFTVIGASTIGGTATVTSTSGSMQFYGAVSSTGTIGSTNSSDVRFRSTLQNNGTLEVGMSTFTVVSTFTNTGTVKVGDGTFDASSSYVNTGTVTRNSGSIIHLADSFKLTDTDGTETATFSNGDAIYVTINDPNRNLLGGTIETLTVLVTSTAAAGSDSETLTLIETSASSGVFRNVNGLPVMIESIIIGNGVMDLSGSGTVSIQYADEHYAVDVSVDTASVSASTPATASTGGGGLSAGSGGGGSITPVTVTTPSTNSTQALLQNLGNIGIAVHNLIKLPSDNNQATQYDTAVYYVGGDGKRHAFPNEKVYLTWYSDFSGVQVISETNMASIPLGANVTYKPGKKMVKFTTDAKVYAVAKGGILRWVKTEGGAVEMYGTNWNQKIDDINDAFYSNYKFGSDINGLADFNPATVEASVVYPSDSLSL